MDLSIAKSIYEHAKVVKNNKVVSDAERVIEEYSVFQRDNPSLPYIAPFCGLDHTGPLIKILTQHGEDKIDTIIKVFEHIFCSNENLIITKAPVRSSHLKNPTTIKTPINKEPIHRMKQQNLEKNQELTLFLDSILKETKFMETEWLEFKRFNSRPDLDNFGKILAGLANTAFINNVAFAYLIIGIDDLKAEICGTKIKTVSEGWKSFEKKLRQSFQPSLEFEVDEFDYKNDPQKHIVIIKIHAASDKPVAYCGESFIRHGDKTVPLTDFPNYQNIFLNSTQQTVIDNSITIIIQNPQIIFKIKNEKKSCIKLIIELIIALLSVSGVSSIITISCDNSDKKMVEFNTPINNQNNSLNQSPIVNGDATINYYANNDSKENHYNTKDSMITSSQSVNKEISYSSSKAIEKVIDKKKRDVEETACLLYRDAMQINPNANHVIGSLKSLVFNYNRFAKKIKLDTVEHKGKFHEQSYGLGSIGDSSSHMLPFIIFNVEKFIKINNINCN